MQAQVQPLPNVRQAVPTGLFLITEDGLGIAATVATALEQRGAKTAILPSTSLKSPAELISALTTLAHREPIAGIVHLAALAQVPLPQNLAQWREYNQIHAKSLFQILQFCATDWKPKISDAFEFVRRVISASLLGGYFGRNGAASLGLATGGASNGLLKTLVAEWSGVEAKAIDFDMSLSKEGIAAAIVQELLLPGGSLEIGYPQGKRTIFKTVPAPLTTPVPEVSISPAADWVVLVTGGARGITAEVVKEFMVPGMTLVLVGRSPEPNDEPVSLSGIEDIAELRRVSIEQTRISGQYLTPVQIENQIQRILQDRDIRRNLSWFRQRGTVEYHSLDVRNETAFASLIQYIYSHYGRLDAVIHGAGSIEDKLIVDKQLESFDRVYDTKVDSAFLLSRHLQPESLKLLVFFSSVAGRYGNRGQSDYAAANEVVNRLAWQLKQHWPATRVISINWGPWDTTGMASESVKSQFRDRGIIPITLESGRQFFVQEVDRGNGHDVEIIAGTGPWSKWEAAEESFATPFVLLMAQPQFQPNSTVTLEHTFCLANDPYLWDHQLDGNLVLPATVAVEWLAEFVQSAWTDWVVTEIRDLKVLRGLITNKNSSKTVLLRAKASSHADAESLNVVAQVLDFESNHPYYRATVVLRPELSPPPIVSLPQLTAGTSLEPAKAYRDYLFHGQDFQLIQTIDRITPQGIDAWVVPSSAQLWKSPRGSDGSRDPHKSATPVSASWLFDPGLLDTAPQLAIVWARVQYNTTALPSQFGSAIRYAPTPLTPMRILFRVKTYDQHNLVYDALFADKENRIYLQLTDIQSTCDRGLNRLAIP